ncbi:AAA family ATPase [Streptosporangium lutulentum]
MRRGSCPVAAAPSAPMCAPACSAWRSPFRPPRRRPSTRETPDATDRGAGGSETRCPRPEPQPDGPDERARKNDEAIRPTGAPGAGKTSILRLLEATGHSTVGEAATAVIASGQARGEAEPWTRASFIDDVVALQRRRQTQAVAAATTVQIYDRSPICTHALGVYLGYPVSSALSAEIDRITRERIYERQVFFVRNLGFCEPTAARRISFEDSLKFERVHEESYRAFGYELIDIPVGAQPIGWPRSEARSRDRPGEKSLPRVRADLCSPPGRAWLCHEISPTPRVSTETSSPAGPRPPEGER